MRNGQMARRAFEVKALDGDAPEAEGKGRFSGYASTWDQDLYGDVIVKGAFADTLAEDFGGTGAGIPIHFEHESGNPFDIVGVSTRAFEDEKGLWLEGEIDLSTPEGERTYGLMKRGLIHQMSIGFIPGETSWVTPEGKSAWEGYREIRSLKLFEVSVVQVAANQACEVAEVKSASGTPVVKIVPHPVTIEVKAGRAISAANEEKIRAAYDALGEILESVGGGTPADDGGDDEEADPSDESGEEGKAADRAVVLKDIAEYLGGNTL